MDRGRSRQQRLLREGPKVTEQPEGSLPGVGGWRAGRQCRKSPSGTPEVVGISRAGELPSLWKPSTWNSKGHVGPGMSTSSFQANGPSSLLQIAWIWAWKGVRWPPTILRPFCSRHSARIPPGGHYRNCRQSCSVCLGAGYRKCRQSTCGPEPTKGSQFRSASK